MTLLLWHPYYSLFYLLGSNWKDTQRETLMAVVEFMNTFGCFVFSVKLL